jgi:predicted nucleotidyltransferase
LSTICRQLSTNCRRWGLLAVQEIFSSQARISVMKLFLMNPGHRYYLRQVATLTDQPVRAVEREVSKLLRVGLISETREGNRRYYQVNANCPIFPELKSIFLKTVALGDALREYVAEAGPAIQVAFVYGSYARGDESTTSDIDLFLVGSITGKELSGILGQAQRELGREINPVTMSAEEFRARLKGQDHFLLSVLDEPKVFLVGDDRDLEALAG